MKKAKMLCFMLAIFVVSAANSYAVKIVYDFDYQDPIEYFWIDDNSFDPNPACIDFGEDGHYAFKDGQMTFVAGQHGTPSTSVDGHTLTHYAGTQWGTLGLYWDAPITSATIDLAVTDKLDSEAKNANYTVYNQGDALAVNERIFDDGSDVTYLSLYLDFAAGFDCIFLKTMELCDIDTITFHSSEPIPEPATMLLMATGIISIVGLRKKRNLNIS